MKEVLSEYGTLIIAVIGFGIMIWGIITIPAWLHQFCISLVNAITGVC